MSRTDAAVAGRGLWRRHRRGAETVVALDDRLDIAALLDRRPEELSHGERQRGAIARALVVDPPGATGDRAAAVPTWRGCGVQPCSSDRPVKSSIVL